MGCRAISLGVVLAAVTVAAAKHEVTPKHSPKFPGFGERVREYVRLHREAEKQTPPIKDKTSAEQIAAHKQALVAAIRAARPNAKQGEIFAPGIAERFVAVIRSEVRGRGGVPAKRTIVESNPKKPDAPVPIKVAVNAAYPDKAPLSTMPPSLLLRLPSLPEELEYRFVGRDLILRDVAANLIVDFLPGAVPASAASVKVRPK